MGLIESLIDKQDNYEIIRDRVAQILADEVASQMSLAVAGGKDPELWHFKVFTENTNPFELIENVNGKIEGDAEIANVWLENVTFTGGNNINGKKTNTIINIDCVSSKSALNDETGGIITPADKRASLDCERIGRLVRNILDSANYETLGFTKGDKIPGISRRNVSRFQKLALDRDDQPAEASAAGRISLSVDHLEFSPQITPGDLDLIVTEIKRDSITGEVLASITIDLT
jgi:hypothetical protein